VLTAYGLGRVWFRKTRVPHEIVFATGAALLSLIVFALLACGVAGRPAFAAVAAVGVSCLFLTRNGVSRPSMEWSHPLWMLLPFAVLYLVHALAPEIQPDAIGYHLGNVAEYLRQGRFPDRVDFYEILPHGVEMLFTFAFAFGAHSAAKLVHFAMLVASVPLVLSIGRRLGLEPPLAALGAVFYVVTPVVGATGTCAYVDVAFAFYTLAAVYLLLQWHEERSAILLVSAGIAAGFCYGAKITGLQVAACAALWLLVRREWKATLVFSAASAAMIVPWMIRAFSMTGNPMAPLANRLFPNPYFHILSEQILAFQMRRYGGESWPSRILDLTIHGQSSLGLLGPLWLLAPLGLLALRRPVGRLLLCVGALLALPWLMNTSARFLIPALPFLALAMLVNLPRRVAWIVVLAHAVLSWPAVVSLYADTYVWRLRGLPVAAALRIIPEDDYLRRNLPEYVTAGQIRESTPPNARILDLSGTAAVYTERDTYLFYQSAQAELCFDALRTAHFQRLQPLHDLRGSWPEVPLIAVRFRQQADDMPNWTVAEASFYRGDFRLRPSSRWSLDAWPNIWEAPFALDSNVTTYWATWEPVKPGMFLEVRFDRPQWLTGAGVTGLRIEQKSQVAIYGQSPDGAWRLLSANLSAEVRQDADLRTQAARALKRAGYTHIIAPLGDGGNGALGHDLFEQQRAWHIEMVTRTGDIALFKIL